MTPEEIARNLTKGAALAIAFAADDWQFPSKTTFDSNGIWAAFIGRNVGGRGSLVERENRPCGKRKRAAYRLTPLGIEVRNALLLGKK